MRNHKLRQRTIKLFVAGYTVKFKVKDPWQGPIKILAVDRLTWLGTVSASVHQESANYDSWVFLAQRLGPFRAGERERERDKKSHSTSHRLQNAVRRSRREMRLISVHRTGLRRFFRNERGERTRSIVDADAESGKAKSRRALRDICDRERARFEESHTEPHACMHACIHICVHTYLLLSLCRSATPMVASRGPTRSPAKDAGPAMCPRYARSSVDVARDERNGNGSLSLVTDSGKEKAQRASSSRQFEYDHRERCFRVSPGIGRRTDDAPALALAAATP